MSCFEFVENFFGLNTAKKNFFFGKKLEFWPEFVSSQFFLAQICIKPNLVLSQICKGGGGGGGWAGG